jgi:hypothetical protein
MATKSAKLHPNEKTRLGARAAQIQRAGSAAGIIFLGAALVLGLIEGDSMQRFFHSYLTGYTYWLSIACGALWFVLLHHLVSARWSVTVRRTAEFLTAPFGVLLVLGLVIALPILLGNESLYLWSKAEMQTDHLIHIKSAWLNSTFFPIRVVFYLAVMTGMAMYFRGKSIEQDTGSAEDNARLGDTMRRASAPAMIVFALVLAFIGFDLLMSLEPRWFSTMFGVYYFAGAGIGAYAMIALIPMLLQKLGAARHSITVEHYHDVGKMLFAFVFFWGYIAFCQFMLIWYANIPEETAWFLPRIFGEWQIVAIILLVVHFAVPFTLLLSRHTKRRLQALALFSVWMLIMHWVDLFWIVMPALSPTEFTISPIDFCAVLGIGGLFIAAVAHAAGRNHVIPIKDPRLGESLKFENM